MQTNNSLKLERKFIVAHRYVLGSPGETLRVVLGLDNLPAIEEAMDDSGEFFFSDHVSKYKSLTGIIYSGPNWEEVEVPWKQYDAWLRPEKITADVTTIYSPVRD